MRERENENTVEQVVYTRSGLGTNVRRAKNAIKRR